MVILQWSRRVNNPPQVGNLPHNGKRQFFAARYETNI
jgi:hypothetical protein